MRTILNKRYDKNDKSYLVANRTFLVDLKKNTRKLSFTQKFKLR